jgi:hypothetical protein
VSVEFFPSLKRESADSSVAVLMGRIELRPQPAPKMAEFLIRFSRSEWQSGDDPCNLETQNSCLIL